jgi:lysophospholipase L1-like esterase
MLRGPVVPDLGDRCLLSLALALVLFSSLGCSGLGKRRTPPPPPPPAAIVEDKIALTPAKAPEPDPPVRRGLRTKGELAAEMAELDVLGRKLGASAHKIETPCRNTKCEQKALDSFFKRLDKLDRVKDGVVRIIQLGDSHIAADYITRTTRAQLQDRFGNAGRGFVPADQRAEYGGRRVERKGWERLRCVDPKGPGNPFGFAGMYLESEHNGAELTYELEPDDDDLVLYYQAQPKGANLKIFAESELLATVPTKNKKARGLVERIEIPEHRLGAAIPPAVLKVTADGPNVKFFGLSFESLKAGVLYDSIGPVGADARVYLQMDQTSMAEQLDALRPDLVVLMVGGNDALMIRKGERTLEDVRTDHEALITQMQRHLPTSECLVFGPMDAAERMSDGRLVSKTFIKEVRDLQREISLKKGCAFWDAYEAMGGAGSFGRWLREGIMNEDLIHPRAKGGDLIGHLFAQALINAYLGK